MKQYDLADLRSFLAVVNAGSFNRAAEQLQTSTAAVSRRVAGLERELGVRLLNRTTRRLDLTESGKQFYADVTTVMQSLEEAEERVSGASEQIRGTLRVAAPLTFGTQCLGPLLPAFLRQHPELRLQVQLEDQLTDMIADQVDLAIRIGTLPDSSYVATRIADIDRVVCASPDYLAQHGAPQTPDDLKSHNCLHYNNLSVREEWSFRGERGTFPVAVGGSFCANNGELLREAALQGVGIVALPRFMIAGFLDDGHLQPLLSGYNATPLSLQAVRPSRAFTPARVRRFIEFLQQAFSDWK